MPSIGIFGGTFDPVHNGHLKTSMAIQEHCQFDTYNFLPCKSPVLKSPIHVSNEHRLKMLELALSSHPQFKIDLREMERSSPSYMVDTLSEIRKEQQDASLNLIMGYDAFLSLPQWYKWQKLIELANLIVLTRTHFSQTPLPIEMSEFIKRHKVDEKKFLNQKAGSLYFFNAGDYDISSSQIRKDLEEHKDVSGEIPPEVYAYIKQQGLYQ